MMLFRLMRPGDLLAVYDQQRKHRAALVGGKLAGDHLALARAVK